MIDTKALRNKILDLAISGKLTEQLPEDGNAQDLYTRIQEEKAKLIAEGKIKKEKPLPPITDDEILFDIPDNWKWVRLKDICTKIVDGDHNPPAGVKYKTDFMMLSAQNIINDRIDNIESARFLTEEVFVEENKRTRLEKNDVLLTIVGTIGRSCVYTYDYNVCFQRSVSVITTLSLPLFLKYSFDTTAIQRFMESNATGAAQIGFYLNKLEKLLVPLPPLAEQKRIVSIVEDTFSVIDRIEKAQDSYYADQEVLKNKIIDAGIRGKLTEQLPEDGNAEDLYAQIQEEKAKQISNGLVKKSKSLEVITEDKKPYVFPKGWKVCYIDDIAFVTKLAGFEYTNVIADNICENGIPLFKGKNIQKGELISKFESFIPENISDELPRSQLVKKCLLTPYVGTIGNVAIFDGSFKAHLGSNVGKIELYNSETEKYILEEYVLYYLRSKIGYFELTKYKKATAQESISIEAIRNVIIAIPPLAEQQRIVNTINTIINTIVS